MNKALTIEEEALRYGLTVEEFKKLNELNERLKDPKILTEDTKDFLKQIKDEIEEIKKIEKDYNKNFYKKSEDEKVDKGKVSSIYDVALYHIGKLKTLKNDVEIELFKIYQEAMIMRRDGTCYDDMDKYKELVDQYTELTEFKEKIRTTQILLDNICDNISERLYLNYDRQNFDIDDEDVKNLCTKAMHCLVDGVQRTAKDGYASYVIAQKLKTDVIPYLFDQLIDCAQRIVVINSDTYFTREQKEYYKQPHKERFEKIKKEMIFAATLADELLDYKTDKYTLTVTPTSTGKLNITKKDNKNISKNEDMSIYIFGKQKEDTFTVSVGDGSIEKRVTKYDIRGLGFENKQKFEGGSLKKNVAVGNLIATLQTGENLSFCVEIDAVKYKNEKTIEFKDSSIKNISENNVGKISMALDIEDKKGSMQLSAKGIEYKNTVAIQTLEKLYHMLTVEAAVLNITAKAQIKEVGSLYIPSASVKDLPISLNAKVGTKEISVISLKALSSKQDISASLENTAIKIGDKIFAKVKNNTDIDLEKDDLISIKSGNSIAVSLGNNTAWVTASYNNGNLEFKPITEDEFSVSTAFNMAKDVIAIGRTIKNGIGEKIISEGKGSEERLKEKINEIEDYFDR